jgi:hypothetical protein
MRYTLPVAAILAALTFAPPLHAQKVAGGPDPDRKAANVFVSTDDFTTLAGASISYTPPVWHDRYEGMLAAIKGSNYTRLGKNWWTTFDTIGALEIGGTRIAAGSYYLGLAVDKDGVFTLLVFDSRQAMQDGLLPGTTALYRGDAKAAIRAPLTFARSSLQDTVVKMEITITADEKDPANGRFSIRWGKHELSAPVKYTLATPAGTAAPKK